MTNTEFFSKIYGSDVVSILSKHDMKIISATETTATIEYRSSLDGFPHHSPIRCDDAVSMADALTKYASERLIGVENDKSLFETVAAEIREALEKHPTHLVHMALEEDLYEKLVNMGSEITHSVDNENENVVASLRSLAQNARVPLNALSKEQREKRIDEAKELLVPLLTEAVSKETYGVTGVRITPSSNDDYISPDSIMKAYNEYRELTEKKSILLKDYETFKSYLASELYAKYFWEWEADEEAELFECVSEHIETAVEGDEKLTEAWETLKATYNPYDILELGGLTDGIYTDTDAFLNNATYYINLMFAGNNERNVDLVSIYGLFMEDDTFKNADEFARYQDNALSYLIRQQGYTTADVFGVSGQNDDSKFIGSVNSELDNTSNSMNELTFLTSCNGVELADLLDKIAKGEGYIEFPKQTETGLFNEWAGGGSVLEIELEKPAVFPADMVRNVQLEGAKTRLGEYTVDDVYGLTGSVWSKSTVKLTDTPPVLREEDFEATRKLLSDAAKKEAEKTNSDIEQW